MKSETAKERLISASLQLMLSRGYAATSVDDICSAAQVSKGSFYHFFKSKEELGLAMLDDFFRQSREATMAGSFNQEPDPVKRLRGYLHFIEENAETFWEKGCILGNFANELSNTHPIMRERVSLILQRVTESMAERFAPIQQKYPDREELSAIRLAELLVSLIEGALVLSRAHDDWSYLTRALKGFRLYTESLLN
ncbi:MAG: TetR/AcrR family transcriptional regulator [candidate division Zixibacteria bacterium]|jgi:TetR/AcrR family transcriptional repressor of nem operon|nr:TetR/AcrR family transcriptional regulator [candidate division Zixibacteria bacterium]